jgi:hypothetical protein
MDEIHYDFTYLGYLWQCNTNRMNPICIALPKVAKISGVIVAAGCVLALSLRQCK